MWTPLLSVYLGSNSQPEIVANETLVVWDPLTKHIYLKPKWGPLFLLEKKALFWRVFQPKQVPDVAIHLQPRLALKATHDAFLLKESCVSVSMYLGSNVF